MLWLLLLVCFLEILWAWVSEKQMWLARRHPWYDLYTTALSYPKSYPSILHYSPSIVYMPVLIHRISFITSKSEVYDRCTVVAISSRNWNIPGYCRKRVRYAGGGTKKDDSSFMGCDMLLGKWFLTSKRNIRNHSSSTAVSHRRRLESLTFKMHTFKII